MNVILEDSITIQTRNLRDFARFRAWTKSAAYPARGDYSFLEGDVWIDLVQETLAHNQVRVSFAPLAKLITDARLGHFVGRGMRLVHQSTRVSTEPDGVFVSYEALRSGRVQLENGVDSLEIIGAPDMVLEIVSKTSIQKDTVALRELYATAGIPEYWLVDPLGDELAFDILRLTARGYSASRKSDGWIKSAVFGKSFKLVQDEGSGGLPAYRLLVR
jgi:Uma2 family endonuclease